MEKNEKKEVLLAEKARLEAELATVGKQNPQNPQDWDAIPGDRDDDRSDENDNADALEDLVNDEAIVRKLEAQLLDVNQALEGIEKGTYGACEVCGGAIEADRLEANPAARTCKAHMGA